MSKLAFISGKVFTYQDLKFYAMNGYVCMHDEVDGSFQVLSCDKILERVSAINEEARQLKSSSKASDGERRIQLFRVAADLGEALKEAKYQGDHNDPLVQAWAMRHRPWARSRSKASLSGSANFETGRMQPMPRGRGGRPTIRPTYTVPVAQRTAPKKLILV
jgi:hypothetical protein